MGVQEIGEHELRNTRRRVVRRGRVQPRDKGNLCTLFGYCERILGRPRVRFQGADRSCSDEGNVAATRGVTVTTEYQSQDKYSLVSS
jgi:hypothetical protein